MSWSNESRALYLQHDCMQNGSVVGERQETQENGGDMDARVHLVANGI